jgi:hypothetical protein
MTISNLISIPVMPIKMPSVSNWRELTTNVCLYILRVFHLFDLIIVMDATRAFMTSPKSSATDGTASKIGSAFRCPGE